MWDWRYKSVEVVGMEAKLSKLEELIQWLRSEDNPNESCGVSQSREALVKWW